MRSLLTILSVLLIVTPAMAAPATPVDLGHVDVTLLDPQFAAVGFFASWLSLGLDTVAISVSASWTPDDPGGSRVTYTQQFLVQAHEGYVLAPAEFAGTVSGLGGAGGGFVDELLPGMTDAFGELVVTAGGTRDHLASFAVAGATFFVRQAVPEPAGVSWLVVTACLLALFIVARVKKPARDTTA